MRNIKNQKSGNPAPVLPGGGTMKGMNRRYKQRMKHRPNSNLGAMRKPVDIKGDDYPREGKPPKLSDWVSGGATPGDEHVKYDIEDWEGDVEE